MVHICWVCFAGAFPHQLIYVTLALVLLIFNIFFKILFRIFLVWTLITSFVICHRINLFFALILKILMVNILVYFGQLWRKVNLTLLKLRNIRSRVRFLLRLVLPAILNLLRRVFNFRPNFILDIDHFSFDLLNLLRVPSLQQLLFLFIQLRRIFFQVRVGAHFSHFNFIYHTVRHLCFNVNKLRVLGFLWYIYWARLELFLAWQCLGFARPIRHLISLVLVDIKNLMLQVVWLILEL